MFQNPLLRICLALLAVFCLALPADTWARTIHVAIDPALTAPSKAGNRTLLKTIGSAVQRAVAGDRIVVHPGDYRNEKSGWGVGIIGIGKSGRKDSPIRIEGADVRNPPLLLGVVLNECEWVRISKVKFVNPEFRLPAGWQDMPAALLEPDTEDIKIEYDEPIADRKSKFEKKFARYLALTRGLEHDTAIDLRNAKHVRIEDCEIRGYWAGVQTRHARNVLIAENQFFYCVQGIFTWEPTPSLSDALIRNNYFSQSFENGIELRKSCQRVIVQNNKVHHTGINPINVREGSQDCQVIQNDVRYGGYYAETMQNPGSSGINIHTAKSGNIVDSNFVAYQVDETGADGNGVIIDLMQDEAEVIVRSNTCYRNMGAGLNTTESPNAQIMNNLFIENGYAAKRPRQGAGVKLSRKQDVRQTIVNNVFYNNRVAGIMGHRLAAKQTLVDHNFYYSKSNKPMIWDDWEFGQREYRTLQDIRGQLSWEGHGQTGSLRFLEHAARPYEVPELDIPPDSPLKDAGIKSPHAGVARKGTSYDIGPVEH